MKISRKEESTGSHRLQGRNERSRYSGPSSPQVYVRLQTRGEHRDSMKPSCGRRAEATYHGYVQDACGVRWRCSGCSGGDGDDVRPRRRAPQGSPSSPFGSPCRASRMSPARQAIGKFCQLQPSLWVSPNRQGWSTRSIVDRGGSKQLTTWQAFREATACVEYNVELDLAHGSSKPRGSRGDKK